ncbi:MAG: hypothetical protein RLN87_08150 [Parasphingopyxis sp.]|uniref:hypothetical protein n=1 Tax=Parasphingopyxis sp. TaxID=1920299 RepID=UPI0032EE3BCD
MTATTAEQIEGWRSAIGREDVATQMLDPSALARFALAVGQPAGSVPPLAHWAFFLSEPADDQIGADGHPKRGNFLPPVTLPRRMFAASDIAFEAPLAVGEPARLVSTIADVQHKSGRSGDLVFATVERALEQDGTTRVRERQSYVYREAGAAVAMPEPAGEDSAGERWTPDPVHLFRFSAATFNAHRIHYDRDYAKHVEGYPSLVIHGPFTASKLAELAARDGTLARFSFRAQAPLFEGQPVFLQRGDEQGAYRAERADGAVAMTASAKFH